MNDDGTPLSLTGYRIIRESRRTTTRAQSRVDNPGLTRYVIERLPPATYYFIGDGAIGARRERVLERSGAADSLTHQASVPGARPRARDA